MPSNEAPIVFISYSWKPTSNKTKTLRLAERLENEGVHVIIDEWNLSEGQDKFQFMEQMVNNPDVKRVLIICNKEYAEKANTKSGGVGIESLIISDEVYSKVEQKKFVPVIFERDNNNKEYVPTFIKSRIYIDLSNDEIFEDEYEKLMRNLFDKPTSKRPPRGNPPAYILNEDSIFLRTSHKVLTIQNALINEKKNSQVFIDEYFTTFIEALSDFEIINEDLNDEIFLDDFVLTRIEEMKILRDDFIKFLETIFTYSDQIDFNKFIDFIEKLFAFLLKERSIKYPERFTGEKMKDHYKFFFNESFLYLTTLLLEREKYNELSQILYTGYLALNEKHNSIESYTFIFFNQHAKILEDRNQRLQMNRISLTADLLRQRADLPKYSFDKLRESDALLYYIGIMTNESENQIFWLRWWPHTTVYHIYKLSILEKLISKRHFEKMKPLFKVNTLEELESKVKRTIDIKADKLDRWNYGLPHISEVFNINKMCTYD